MMSGKQDIPIVRVFVQRRLVSRTCLEIIGADEFHVQTRTTGSRGVISFDTRSRDGEQQQSRIIETQ
jgi:hypothetical protein